MVSLIITAISLVIFIYATQPEELRDNRWVKIVFSTPAVWLIAQMATGGPAGGFMAVGCTLLLAFFWAPVISHYTSGWLLDQVQRFSTDEGGFRVDFSQARIHIDQRQFPESIKAVRHELRKDPKNYEGHLLLAGLYREMKQPSEAMAALAVILDNPAATEEQKRVARAGLEELRNELGAVN